MSCDFDQKYSEGTKTATNYIGDPYLPEECDKYLQMLERGDVCYTDKTGKHCLTMSNPIPPTGCPDGYHAQEASVDYYQKVCTWIDHSTDPPKTRPCLYTSPTGTCLFYGGCANDQPEMSNESKLKCCVDGYPDPWPHNCAIGWCSKGSACGPFMANYCKTNGYDNNCKKYLQTTESAENKKKVIQTMMEANYTPQKSVIANPFNENAIEICSGAYDATPDASIAGTCDPYLLNACQAVTSLDQLKNDANLMKLCGCFLDQSTGSNIYSKYYNAAIPYNCTPPCIYPDGVRPGGGPLGGFLKCEESLCVMDDVTIDIINSKYKGNFNFKQVCPNQGGAGNTECWISKQDYEIINSKAKDQDININQVCSPCKIYDFNNPGDVKGCPGGCGTMCSNEQGCGTECPTCTNVHTSDATSVTKCGVGCGGQCNANKQCVDSTCPACIRGFCKNLTCSTTNPCPAGFICESGKCVVACAGNYDCKNGEICINGQCKEGCLHNHDCGINHICENGKCKAGCLTDSNCEVGYYCKKGKCEIVPPPSPGPSPPGPPPPGGKGGNGKGSNTLEIIGIVGGSLFLVILITILIVRHFKLKKEEKEER